MAVSSNSLFHFTSTECKTLKLILNNGFRVSFSNETYPVEGPGVGGSLHYSVPMVCFCDIPLSIINNHVGVYSSSKKRVFGVGMKKEWGKSKGLNPVLYVSEGSHLSFLLVEMAQMNEKYLNISFTLRQILNQSRNSNDFAKFIPNFNALLGILEEYNYGTIENKFWVDDASPISSQGNRLLLFTKPIQGDFTLKNGDVTPDYVYYNEREWRYIPSQLMSVDMFIDPVPEMIYNSSLNIDPKKMSSQEIKEHFNLIFQKQTQKPFRNNNEFLSYTVNDISFIIVHDQNDVNELIDFILDPAFISLGGYPISSSDINNTKHSLISKILSYEQIQTDIFSH